MGGSESRTMCAIRLLHQLISYPRKASTVIPSGLHHTDRFSTRSRWEADDFFDSVSKEEAWACIPLALLCVLLPIGEGDTAAAAAAAISNVF